MRQLSVTLTILSTYLCSALASIPIADLLQDTLDRIEDNSRKPNPLYADLTRSYARPVSPSGTNQYDPILFDRIAWMEYLAHVSVEAELAGIAHALMGQMVQAVNGVPAMQPAVQAAVEGVRVRLGERQVLPNVPISKPFVPPKHLPSLPHHPASFPQSHPNIPHGPSPNQQHPAFPHHPSPPAYHSAAQQPHKEHHRHHFGLLKAIGHAVKSLVKHGGNETRHPAKGSKGNFAREHPIAAAIAQAVTGPSHQPYHHPTGHGQQPVHQHKDIRQIAMEAAKDALAHLMPHASMEALPDLLGQILHALLARQIDRASSILQTSMASHRHDEVTGKLKMLLDLVHFDQRHYGTCMPLWDADWQLSWSDKARILELAHRNAIVSSSMETSSLPHAESIRGRILLALEQRDASLRVIEHGVMDPLEHSLMLACWQQKFAQRGLEDALPTYEMALENHYGRNALVRQQRSEIDPRKREWIERIVRDVNEGIASGRYDQPVHVGPFSMIYPPQAAIRPSDKDTERAKYLKGALENDLALKRIRELVDVGEHVDLSGLEQTANARIFQMQHRLHDLARRDEMAKKINLRLSREENQANMIERERLERQMRHAIIGEQQAKTDADAKQRRQLEVDAALARYNAEMSRLHDKYRRRYEGLMQAVEQGRVMPEQRRELHRQMRTEQQAEADAVKARYEHAVQAAVRKYAEHMARARQTIEQQARVQAYQKASLQPKHKKERKPAFSASQSNPFAAGQAQPSSDPYQFQSDYNYDPLTQQPYSSQSNNQYAASPTDQRYADIAPTGASGKNDVARGENYDDYLY